MAKRAFAITKKSGFVIVGLLVTIAAVSVLSGSGGKTEPVQVSKSVGGLVGAETLPAMEGELCIPEGASASPGSGASLFELAALQQQDTAATPQAGAASGPPSSAIRAAVANRLPSRILRDSYPSYSAVAVDSTHNEVILAAEDMLSLMVHDRSQNTPPTVRSEPRRIIHGLNTSLEFVCGVYVDPASGDVYAINNDTLNRMAIFSRKANGNAVPDRYLEVPQGTFGITVDEKSQELMLTVEDDNAVVTFPKAAKEKDSPIRILQGEHTLLANAHGITHDPKTDRIYVTNFGSVNKNVHPATGPWEGTTGRGVGRAMWPAGRNYSVPGTGEFRPPSINVYARTAEWDTAPLQVIQGPKTLLNWPIAVAVDSERGELYVANDTTSQILVFKADANGDVAPIRILGGAKTLIRNPTGVAVDMKNQELWVTSLSSHNATVYKLSASGNTPPLRVIRGAPENVPTATFINARVAYDTKRDELLVAS